jgi:hypothetical protein
VGVPGPDRGDPHSPDDALRASKSGALNSREGPDFIEFRHLRDRDINSVPPPDVRNPTAENVAFRAAEEIHASGRLPDGTRLEDVTGWEGPRNSVTWRP